jgi:adenylate cyclase
MDKTLQIIGSDSKDIFAGEFYRLQGELLLALSPENAADAAADAAASAAAQAETWFLRALENARDVQAGMVELRAAISLCRLWSRRGTDQGKAEQGRRTLEDVYSRMTEGFATADLMEASKLLGG